MICWWMNCRLHTCGKGAEQGGKKVGLRRSENEKRERDRKRGIVDVRNRRWRWMEGEWYRGTLESEWESERWRGESLHLRANHWQHAFSRRTQRHKTNKGDHLSRATPTGSFNDWGHTHTHRQVYLIKEIACHHWMQDLLWITWRDYLEIDSYTRTHINWGDWTHATYTPTCCKFNTSAHTHTAHNTSHTLGGWAKFMSYTLYPNKC